MSLAPQQQIDEAIKKASSILVTFKKACTVDDTCAALSLAAMLSGNGKRVTVAADGFELPAHLGFLRKRAQSISPTLPDSGQFIIRLATGDRAVTDLSYERMADGLEITLGTPDAFSRKDVSVRSVPASYDLIFVIGTPDLGALGPLFESRTQMFYDATIVNIDAGTDNEGYGQINLVDATATSVSEMVYALVKQRQPKLLDQELATVLLAGIVSATKIFKIAQVTPKSLNTVSDLLSRGAKRDVVIRNLYQNRPISTLQLWGRTLARLRTDENLKIAWSLLTHDDFARTGAKPSDLDGVVDELIRSTPHAKIVVLLAEKQPGQVTCLVATDKNPSATELTRRFGPTGSEHAAMLRFEGRELAHVEQEVIAEIRSKLNMIE